MLGPHTGPAQDQLKGRQPASGGLHSVTNQLEAFLNRLNNLVQGSRDAANVLYGNNDPPNNNTPSVRPAPSAVNELLHEIELTLDGLERNIQRIISGN